jgi:hypothetical protein
MGHAKAAMPNISALERRDGSGASHAVPLNSIPAGPFYPSSRAAIHVTAPVVAMGRRLLLHVTGK